MAPTAADPGIHLAGLTKSYGTVPAVRGIDLDIASGETVALLGPNGAGKSTTLDIVLGLGRPDAGEVTVFGLPPSEAVAAGLVGGMLQSGAVIIELSVREVLTMVASLYPHPLPVEAVIAIADIGDLADRRTNKLSGGQVQRVRFAIALVANARLLVLDEPTVGLDVEARRTFWATMRANALAGTTIVFATHYLDEADAYADRIVLMAGGRIVADGATTEIKAHVGGRVIRATLPGVAADRLTGTPGVARVERHGDSVELVCDDSDRAIRCLLADHPDLRDIEIRGAALEDAFVELTRSEVASMSRATPVGGARTTVYTRYEILRTFRNRRFFVFSLVFPLILFLVVAGPNRDEQLDGIPFATYYMAGMVAWGSMTAVIAGGARIAAERALGWTRQLRISPLPTRTYMLTKILSGYVMAALSIVVLYTAGTALGVRLGAARWLEMTILVLVGLVPFAALGIVLGHVLTVDSMGPALGGITALFALLGGAWGPTAQSGVMFQVVQCLPSYWLVQAGKTAYGGDPWPVRGVDHARRVDHRPGRGRGPRVPARHRPRLTPVRP